jgi:hypothetical protein
MIARTRLLTRFVLRARRTIAWDTTCSLLGWNTESTTIAKDRRRRSGGSALLVRRSLAVGRSSPLRFDDGRGGRWLAAARSCGNGWDSWARTTRISPLRLNGLIEDEWLLVWLRRRLDLVGTAVDGNSGGQNVDAVGGRSTSGSERILATAIGNDRGSRGCCSP